MVLTFGLVVLTFGLVVLFPYTELGCRCTATTSDYFSYTRPPLWCTATRSDLFLSADKSF